MNISNLIEISKLIALLFLLTFVQQLITIGIVNIDPQHCRRDEASGGAVCSGW